MNIFPPIMSTRSPGLRYTAQGLGDRFHLVSVAYQISISKKEIVRLHLAANHLQGRKLDSFKEIVEIFPKNHIELIIHGIEFYDDIEWKNYLNSVTEEPKQIGYKDHPGWLETDIDFDVSPYLVKRNLINPKCRHELELPERFVTFQWDSTGKDRRLEAEVINKIEKGYLQPGVEKVVVGGNAEIQELADCLSCAAVAISKSKFFAGVDSGFMHVALQVLEVSQIHLYTSVNRFWSHHSFRALETGVQINPHWKKISSLDLLYLRLRYDSPKVTKYVHKLKMLVGAERNEINDRS